jgi:hypothetical protein
MMIQKLSRYQSVTNINVNKQAYSKFSIRQTFFTWQKHHKLQSRLISPSFLGYAQANSFQVSYISIFPSPVLEDQGVLNDLVWLEIWQIEFG